MKERNVLEVLGKNMHDIRYRKNISIQELSKIVNIDIETLMRFESGLSSVLTIEEYIKIADGLGVNYKEITKGINFEQD